MRGGILKRLGDISFIRDGRVSAASERYYWVNSIRVMVWRDAADNAPTMSDTSVRQRAPLSTLPPSNWYSYCLQTQLVKVTSELVSASDPALSEPNSTLTVPRSTITLIRRGWVEFAIASKSLRSEHIQCTIVIMLYYIILGEHFKPTSKIRFVDDT